MPTLPFAKPTFPIRETLVWATDILRGADGSEQRIALRKTPRQQFAYTFPLKNDGEVARMDALMHAGAKGLWYVPLWPQQSVHAATIAAGSTSISLDTSSADYRTTTEGGGYAVIWQADQSEVATVSAVAAGSLTVSALANSYTGTKIIAPCRTGYLLGQPRKRRWSSGACLWEMGFELIDNLYLPGHTASTTYDGCEVITTPAYAPGGIFQQQTAPDVIVIDSTSGRRIFANISDFAIDEQTHQFVLDSPSAAWSHRQWLHHICGRQKSFLIPTFRDDLTLAVACGSGDTTIDVVHRGFTTNYGTNRLRRYVAFRPPGADPIVRRVTALAEVSATVERLTLDAAPGQAFAAGRYLSWCDRCRLAVDHAELVWRLPGRCLHDALLTRVVHPESLYNLGLYGVGVYGGHIG